VKDENGTQNSFNPAEYFQNRARSLKIAAVLNHLNFPFFLLGIILLLWLGAEFFLRHFLSPFTYERVTAVGNPVTAVISPAVVGYWTNRLAIKMLFHPRRRNAVWQGLIPARRADLAVQIAAGVSERLISPDIIHTYLHESGLLPELVNRLRLAAKEILQDKNFRRDAKTFLSRQLAGFLKEPANRERITRFLKQRIEQWSGAGPGEKILEWTKRIWGPVIVNGIMKEITGLPDSLEEIFSSFEESLEQFPRYLEDNREKVETVISRLIVSGLRSLNLEEIVKQQLNKMDEAEVEKMITGTVETELVFIQTSGGIFGALVGLAVMFPFLRFIFGAAGLGLFVLYRLTVK